MDDKTKLAKTTGRQTVAAAYSTKSPQLVNIANLKGRANKVGNRAKRVPRRTLLIILVILLCFAAGFGGGMLGGHYSHSNAIATTRAAQQQYVSNESQLIEGIAKNVGQSVVSIDVKGQDNSATDFFGFAQPQTTESAGTGFIISADGIIVTNRHVVPAGTTSVSVTLSDGTHFDNVQVLGRTSDASSQDIAFLKINDLNGKTVTPVALGDSSAMKVGDKVIAIGNALGQFQNTVTSGIISGFGRDVTAGDQSGLQASENLTDLFQTDAAINEGNSGGPLVNINGEVIGINTAIASDAQNIGFAQPVNDLKGLIASVLNNGQLQQPYLGVRYISLTNDLAKEFNLKVSRGAYITSGNDQPAIVDGSPAARAGLKEKDVITKVNNINVDDKTSLTSALSKFKVGESVTLTVVRGGKTTTIKATLGNAPTG
jgi:serine protease Do